MNIEHDHLEEKMVKIDLNTADEERLSTLPGLGPELARRVVAYRESHGGFRTPEELIEVPGIGEALYQRIADQITVTPLDTLPSTPSEGESPSPEETPTSPTEEEKSTSPPPQPEEPPPSPPPPPPTRSSCLGFWSPTITAIVGGLLGMVFTLLVLTGINHTLDLSRHQAVVELTLRLDSLAQENAQLRDEIDMLRTRLDQLGGLSGRVESAEREVSSLQESVSNLAEELQQITEKDKQIEQTLAEMQHGIERFDHFLQALRDLLNEIEPQTTPSAQSTVGPEPTATPTD